MRSGWIGMLLSGLLAFGGCLTAAQAREAEPLAEFSVASEVWENHSNADGSGLAWDLLRAVFEPAGVKLKITSVPYTRALGLAQRGKVDAVLGVYLNEIENIAYPRWPYADDAVVALGLVGAAAPNLQTLASYRLVWMRGYGFQNQIPNLTDYQEVQRRDGVAQMLKQGRADFYIDDDDEVNILLASIKAPQEFRVTALRYLPIYLGFASTEHGRAMQALYEQRMPQLLRDGTLRAIFARYQEHYPYDSAEEMPHARP